jgi:hypothetical protein
MQGSCWLDPAAVLTGFGGMCQPYIMCRQLATAAGVRLSYMLVLLILYEKDRPEAFVRLRCRLLCYTCYIMSYNTHPRFLTQCDMGGRQGLRAQVCVEGRSCCQCQ